jgi:hypothetical protein
VRKTDGGAISWRCTERCSNSGFAHVSGIGLLSGHVRFMAKRKGRVPRPLYNAGNSGEMAQENFDLVGALVAKQPPPARYNQLPPPSLRRWCSSTITTKS